MRKPIIGLCCLLLSGWSSMAAAGAVSTAADAKNTAANLQDAAQTIRDAERAEAERKAALAEHKRAQAAVALAEQKVAQAETSYLALAAAAQEADAKAKALLAEADKERKLAASARAAADKALAASYAAQSQANSARRQYDAAAAREAEVAAARVLEAPEGQAQEAAEKAEAQRASAYEQADKKVEAAYQRVSAAFAKSDKAIAEANKKEELADKKASAAAASADAAEVAKSAAENGKERLEESKLDLDAARADLASAEADITASKPTLQGNLYLEGNPHYYSWRNNSNGKGYQYIQPMAFTYADATTEYGMQTAYIRSENKTSGDEGAVGTWGDTQISFSQISHKDNTEVRYSLGVNIPTGKASLSAEQHNAVFDEDLVEQGQFGTGWNYTPGISVTRKLAKERNVIAGTYYITNGSYDPASDIADEEVKPGSEWAKYLRYQHLSREWQAQAELGHSGYGSTKLDGSEYYKQGDLWKFDLTYVKKLPQEQSLMLYYWYRLQRPFTSPDALLLAQLGTGNQYGHYYGIMWSKPVDSLRTLRVYIDGMRRDGRGYDPIGDLYVGASRLKYSGGIGYDFQFTPNKRASLDIQRYTMKDTVSVPGMIERYNGYNYLLRYSHNF